MAPESKFHGIFEQIDEDLFESSFVTNQERKITGTSDLRLINELLLVFQSTNIILQIVHRLVYFANLRIKLDVPGFSLRLEDTMNEIYDLIRVKDGSFELEGALTKLFQVE